MKKIQEDWLLKIEVYDQTGRNNYNVSKEMRIKTPMLRSNLCGFSDAYIFVEGTITVAKRTFFANDFVDLVENRRTVTATTSNTANNAAIDGKLTFNNAPLVNCISKINYVLNENAED